MAVRDIDAKALKGYDLGGCEPVKRDTLRGRIAWRQAGQLPGDSGGSTEKHYRLLFELKNARLYSLWIE